MLFQKCPVCSKNDVAICKQLLICKHFNGKNLLNISSLVIIRFSLPTSEKMKLSIKDFCSFLRIWSHLLDKSLMENFIFCAALSSVFLIWSQWLFRITDYLFCHAVASCRVLSVIFFMNKELRGTFMYASSFS